MYLGEIFQQDDAPVHTATLTKTWMLANAVENLENWPLSLQNSILSSMHRVFWKKVSKKTRKLFTNFGTLAKKNVDKFRKIS